MHLWYSFSDWNVGKTKPEKKKPYIQDQRSVIKSTGHTSCGDLPYFFTSKPARTSVTNESPQCVHPDLRPLGLTGEKAAISTLLTRYWSTDQCGYYYCPVCEGQSVERRNYKPKSESKQRTCRSKPGLNPSKDLVQNKFSPPPPLDCTVKTNSNIRHLK